ncbi:AbrB/MazE/SpoVT family DNA-binding domain-containing protein [Rhizobium sp. NLR9b]|uniref:AbrB/MazE/SpoVT family DNA-binding domain-containing protein n=1 Tax=unclassified Rhizobium TaxID=2613769 RepID=UPI001C82B76C|nr:MULTISPECIES: AbrB/MazE/SpoVT family DNA-binding domain-containing protein [unclassified Rhizobium]MBX5230308.1 AbrB/MazE/SpoVT family DNA-binding domain-containing protein [Rhizobium sp. NLR9b]MBX5290977.1 AbrB/MazE/SpoVT family DNA-binding domain-containing protein [Rhizobium sp. NLR10b]
MPSLMVTKKGELTLGRDLLAHLGVRPGEQIEVEKLPGGELRMRAAPPTGTIDDFIGRHAGKTSEPLTIEEMNEISAASWTAAKKDVGQ